MPYIDECACVKANTQEVVPPAVEALTMILDLTGRLDGVSARITYRLTGSASQEGPGPDRAGLTSDLGYIYRKLTDINDRLGRLSDFIG